MIVLPMSVFQSFWICPKCPVPLAKLSSRQLTEIIMNKLYVDYWLKSKDRLRFHISTDISSICGVLQLLIGSNTSTGYFILKVKPDLLREDTLHLTLRVLSCKWN